MFYTDLQFVNENNFRPLLPFEVGFSVISLVKLEQPYSDWQLVVI